MSCASRGTHCAPRIAHVAEDGPRFHVNVFTNLIDKSASDCQCGTIGCHGAHPTGYAAPSSLMPHGHPRSSPQPLTKQRKGDYANEPKIVVVYHETTSYLGGAPSAAAGLGTAAAPEGGAPSSLRVMPGPAPYRACVCRRSPTRLSRRSCAAEAAPRVTLPGTAGSVSGGKIAESSGCQERQLPRFRFSRHAAKGTSTLFGPDRANVEPSTQTSQATADNHRTLETSIAPPEFPEPRSDPNGA